MVARRTKAPHVVRTPKETALRVCYDVLPPPEEQMRFADLARAEDPSNGIAGFTNAILGLLPVTVEAAAITAKKWQNGRTLRVGFMGGSSAQQEFTAKTAKRLSEYANITFEFGVAVAQSDLRISYNPQGGAYSYMGTDCLGIAKSQPTMNLGWVDEAVVLHEHMHALACIHEHQHPDGGIPWNKPAVYASLAGPPNYWDRATIDNNMFAAYAKNQTQFSRYDPKSVMLYPIDKSWVTDPAYAVGFNKTLSATDMVFLGQLYPKAGGPTPGGGPSVDGVLTITIGGQKYTLTPSIKAA